MMADDELSVLRETTNAFINLDPTIVSLVPQVWIKQPSGGRKKQEQNSLPPQKFKFISQSEFTGSINGQDARVISYDYVMMGAHDAVVPLEAQWIDQYGQKWQVVGLIPYNEYETKALVKSVGESARS